jgi:hypothetical protein
LLKRGFFLLALGAALAVAPTGCGGNAGTSSSSSQGSSTQSATTASTRHVNKSATPLRKSAYEKTLSGLGRELGRSVDGLYPLGAGPKGSELANSTVAKLEETRAVVSGVEAELVKIVPPREIAPEHEMLKAGVGELTGQLDKLIQSLKDGDLRAFGRLSQLPSLRKIAQAADAMTQHGYNIIGPKPPG